MSNLEIIQKYSRDNNCKVQVYPDESRTQIIVRVYDNDISAAKVINMEEIRALDEDSFIYILDTLLNEIRNLLKESHDGGDNNVLINCGC